MKLASIKLKHLVEKIGSGVTPKGGDAVYVNAGTSLFRSQNIYNMKFDEVGLAFIDEKTSVKMKNVSVQVNDVLLNITGDSVTRCCLAPATFLPARVNQHVAIIRPDRSKLISEFLMYYLVSPLMQKKMLSLASAGGTRKALTKGMIEEFEIPALSLTTQAGIVSILTQYDDLIENNRRRIKLLEESARLLYREWFVHLRFPGHENTRIINGLPEGWTKKPLRDCFTLNYGKALKSEIRTDGPFPVYGSSGIIGSHNKALVEGAGIIVGRKGNVGSVFWATADFWPIDTVYFVNKDESNLYLYYALQSMTFTSTDVAVPGLNRDFAYSREILIPEEKILSEFITEATLIRKQIETLEKYSNKLAEARDLLLPRLMSGELEV